MGGKSKPKPKEGDDAKKKNKKGQQQQQSPPPPRCPCVHPYKCECGNRPPRPSPGHKWDGEAQAWGGKGHKQKGASGQSASVAAVAVTTAVGRTKVEQWQRLPSQLLDEHCRRQKRRSATYVRTKVDGRNQLFRYRVVLPDAKDPLKNLVFEPSEPVENDEQAKEEGALLALVHLTPSLPHERKLPEPYRTTWLHAIESIGSARAASSSNNGRNEAPPAGTTDPMTTDSSQAAAAAASQAKASTRLAMAATYTSQAEKRRQQDEIRRARNARIRKHEAIRLANQPHKVHMCASIRNQIRNLLRGDAVDLAAIEENEDEEEEEERDGDNPAGERDDGDATAYILERLRNEGFTKRQIRTAIHQSALAGRNGVNARSGDSEGNWEGMYGQCLQWLLSHLDDDQLPEGFDAQAGMLDVISPSAGSASVSNLSPSMSGSPRHPPSQVEPTRDDEAFASSFGTLLRDAQLVRQQAENQKRPVEDVLWERLREVAGEWATREGDFTAARGSNDEARARMNEELETLEAIFGSECAISRSNEQTVVCVHLSDRDKTLQVVLDNSTYPSTRPSRCLVRGRWTPDGTGAACHVELIKFVASLELGEPMIFTIHGEVLSLLQSDSIGSISLYPSNVDSPSVCGELSKTALQPQATQSNRSSRMTTKPRRRPRERAAFWSVSPADTPPATAFPSINKGLQYTRRSLPAAAAREQFLELLHQASAGGGRVVCVSGSTGCGKSTNLPQFVLEDAPSTAKIVVTQPRRIAATGVATRVATERGESRPGVDSVGYVVRGDSALCNRSRLVFCTTGVLLRQLQAEGALNCITHIMIDEVHERHLDTDVVLGLLKKLLPLNPHIVVVLMSATMDADRLAAYWGPNTPRMDIPGRTFPVKDHTLEDVLSLIRFVPSRKGRKMIDLNDEPAEEVPSDNDSGDDDCIPQDDSIDGVPISELVKRVDEASIQYEIIARLIKNLVEGKTYDDDGSILVFLPGAPEIGKATDTINRYCVGLPIVILPLHGGLQPKEQSRVFLSVSPGTTKVVLATNICQTSVTIPDCTVVIDTAKEKQSSYDPSNRMPLLVEKFASKADLMQRRGRAGRVREGVCYKLVSKATLSRLREHGEPEILRCALDQTLLSLLYMGVENGAGNFMATLLDPPAKASLDAAIFNLTKIGAVESGDIVGTLKLTSLGLHLAGIPAPPSVGKSKCYRRSVVDVLLFLSYTCFRNEVLVMGTILGCRSAAIAMASGMSIDRSPFLRVDTFRGRRDDASDAVDREKSQLVLKARSELFKKVGNSDHALLAAVFREWESRGPGAGSRKQFCDNLGLSFSGMRDMSQLAQQLDSSLASIGFPQTDDADRNASSWRIVRACAVAAMSPCQLVKVVRPEARYAETAEGALEKDGVARELKFFIRTEGAREERVFIHPSSFNFSIGSYSCPWLVYHSLVRTSMPFLRDVTECTAYALLLFGGQIEVSVSLDNAEVIVDGWAKLSANPAICSLVGSLREKVDALLARKVDDPVFDVAGSTEMKLIVKLVRGDGHY